MSINSPQNAICTSVAVFLVLITLYFTTNALKRSYEINQLKLDMENRQRELEREQLKLFKQQVAEREIQRQADVLAKLKEHQYYCYDLQIFTLQIDAEKPLKHFTTTDQLNQTTLKQYKKTYRKKDLNKPQPIKKSSSSEPIIYLFVLVFLYLLLKAASDITQHYKEQSRGDKKNNRRCSLQVYAQMKNDRRSSKENRLLTMNARSKSVDRPILQRSKRIYPKLRSYTSVDERPSCSVSSTVLPEISAENIPPNLVVPSFRPKSLLLSDTSLSRRSSVPALSLQQMGILSRRRTSLVDADPLGLETKKRHRMIQRH